jgi:hypothetical protein
MTLGTIMLFKIYAQEFRPALKTHFPGFLHMEFLMNANTLRQISK